MHIVHHFNFMLTIALTVNIQNLKVLLKSLFQFVMMKIVIFYMIFNNHIAAVL